MLRCPRSSREEIEHVHGSILVCTRCDSESSRFPWRLHQWRDPGGHCGQRAGTAPSLASKPASTDRAGASLPLRPPVAVSLPPGSPGTQTSAQIRPMTRRLASLLPWI
jgi:hypothetical protein